MIKTYKTAPAEAKCAQWTGENLDEICKLIGARRIHAEPIKMVPHRNIFSHVLITIFAGWACQTALGVWLLFHGVDRAAETRKGLRV